MWATPGLSLDRRLKVESESGGGSSSVVNPLESVVKPIKKKKTLADLAMEGSMKCIKYMLFGFNLLFAVRSFLYFLRLG
jgi:hypothetical protein